MVSPNISLCAGDVVQVRHVVAGAIAAAQICITELLDHDPEIRHHLAVYRASPATSQLHLDVIRARSGLDLAPPRNAHYYRLDIGTLFTRAQSSNWFARVPVISALLSCVTLEDVVAQLFCLQGAPLFRRLKEGLGLDRDITLTRIEQLPAELQWRAGCAVLAAPAIPRPAADLVRLRDPPSHVYLAAQLFTGGSSKDVLALVGLAANAVGSHKPLTPRAAAKMIERALQEIIQGNANTWYVHVGATLPLCCSTSDTLLLHAGYQRRHSLSPRVCSTSWSRSCSPRSHLWGGRLTILSRVETPCG